MVEDSKGASSLSVWDYIKIIGAFGILIVVYQVGFNHAATYYSSSISALQIEKNNVQEKLDQKIAELGQVKSDFASFRLQNPSREGSTQEVQKSPQTNTSTEKQVQEVSIGRGTTASLFGGSLIISLITTSFEGSPLRYKVLATIGSPGYPNKQINLEDVGYITTYQGKDKFDIRITASDTFSANFFVNRVP